MREHCEMLFVTFNIRYRLSYDSHKIRITFTLFTKKIEWSHIIKKYKIITSNNYLKTLKYDVLLCFFSSKQLD